MNKPISERHAPTEGNQENRREIILEAADCMDWMQVVLNGGPPCFHVDDDGSFCGRAERWAGHDSSHAFVSLKAVLAAVSASPLPVAPLDSGLQKFDEWWNAYTGPCGEMEHHRRKAEAAWHARDPEVSALENQVRRLTEALMDEWTPIYGTIASQQKINELLETTATDEHQGKDSHA